MNHLLQTFVGKQVALLRKKRRLTQQELSVACHLDRSYLSGIESGRRNPTLMTISKIAAALGVKTNELFTDQKS